MTERDIENYLVSRIKKQGGIAIKLVSPSINGLPDRMVLLPKGRMYFVELKAPGKKPRATQLVVHKILEGLGFSVYVADSYAEINKIVKGGGPN